jgi:transcription elongation factor Elf1
MEILFELSKNGNGRKRVFENGEIEAIEDYNFFNEGALVFEFDKKMRITKQSFLFKENVYSILSKTIKFCKENGVELKIKEVERIEELKLPYKCPFCGKEELGLKIYKEIEEGKFKSLPIIPIVYCKNCKRESLYMSKEFLRNLVYEKKELFTEDEIKLLNADEERFLVELRASIAAVFGKKKIGIVKFE